MKNDWDFPRQENIHPDATLLTFTTTAPQAGDSLAILLAKQLASISGTGSSSSPPTPLAANYTNTSPYYAVFTGAGSTPANLYSFSVMNGGTGLATFNGVNLPGGMSVDFTAAPGTKFSSVGFNGSGNSLYFAGSQLT